MRFSATANKQVSYIEGKSQQLQLRILTTILSRVPVTFFVPMATGYKPWCESYFEDTGDAKRYFEDTFNAQSSLKLQKHDTVAQHQLLPGIESCTADPLSDVCFLGMKKSIVRIAAPATTHFYGLKFPMKPCCSSIRRHCHRSYSPGSKRRSVINGVHFSSLVNQASFTPQLYTRLQSRHTLASSNCCEW